MTAKVTLSQVDGAGEAVEYVFTERTTRVLGRAEDCDPRLPDDRRHRTVSRHHCLLDVNPPAARIRDFGSLNGTYVNETRIGRRAPGRSPEEATSTIFPEHDLADGDRIRLGDTVFRVAIAAADEPKRTLFLARCAKCDREIGDAGAGEEYVCASCQAEPAAVLRLLLDLARDGRRDLAPIAG
ncbi:FHA domain-containing protein [Phytomonospora sp. NPDC050363]|uniref:FHA domain-containing protein n=1 Tax=Phytomonospora sp. NPDC050363 TaxID=3155642 RepID=UPI0033CD8044